MLPADHGGEEAGGDALLLVVSLAVVVSVAAVGAPGVLGGVEVAVSSAGVAVRAQEPALEVRYLAMDEFELDGGTLTAQAGLGHAGKAMCGYRAVAGESIGPDLMHAQIDLRTEVLTFNKGSTPREQRAPASDPQQNPNLSCPNKTGGGVGGG